MAWRNVALEGRTLRLLRPCYSQVACLNGFLLLENTESIVCIYPSE